MRRILALFLAALAAGCLEFKKDGVYKCDPDNGNRDCAAVSCSSDSDCPWLDGGNACAPGPAGSPTSRTCMPLNGWTLERAPGPCAVDSSPAAQALRAASWVDYDKAVVAGDCNGAWEVLLGSPGTVFDGGRHVGDTTDSVRGIDGAGCAACLRFADGSLRCGPYLNFAAGNLGLGQVVADGGVTAHVVLPTDPCELYALAGGNLGHALWDAGAARFDDLVTQRTGSDTMLSYEPQGQFVVTAGPGGVARASTFGTAFVDGGIAAIAAWGRVVAVQPDGTLREILPTGFLGQPTATLSGPESVAVSETDYVVVGGAGGIWLGTFDGGTAIPPTWRGIHAVTLVARLDGGAWAVGVGENRAVLYRALP